MDPRTPNDNQPPEQPHPEQSDQITPSVQEMPTTGVPEQTIPADQQQENTAPGQSMPPESPVQQAEKEFIQIEQQVGKRFRDHKLFLPFIILVIILLVWALVALVSSGGNTNKQTAATTPTPKPHTVVTKHTPKPKQTQTLVYGTWTSQSSVIRAVNLGNNSVTTVATLPLSIKKVTVLSPTTLLYIDQTDNNDHGKRISVYNIQQNQITTNIPADTGYGIDDYVLSPNKRYLAIWEVQFNPATNTLFGGKSRVYSVDLTSPQIPNLLYDENTTELAQNGTTQPVPIHYPRAILNNGTVLTDQFVPNDINGGTGWAYGMSVVDFDGTNKQDISSMTNGTYGSQPLLSPDGKFMLFAGYDGRNGDGTAIKNGYRQAILTPDTVELLDTTTFKRYQLPHLPPSNTYSDVQWDKQTGNVIISILSPDTKQMGVYSYDLGKLQATQIPLPLANGEQYSYISQLDANKTLIGLQSTDASNLGNLGEHYAFAYTQLATIDTTGKLSYISVEDPFIQYITLLPGNYFTNVLGTQTQKQTAPQPSPTYALLQGTQNNPQNYNFFLKTTLATLRIQGKSNPAGSVDACQNLGNARCSALGLPANSAGYIICQNVEKADNRTADACY